MDVIVLGHRGMLGHMVVKYLSEKGCRVQAVDYRFPSQEFTNHILNWNGDFIVNAVGAIPQKTDNFDINYTLPMWLGQNAKARVIHAGTDCEIDPDLYGTSKKIASDYIKTQCTNTKILKSSIIGPELASYGSLFEWFLRSNGVVRGYTKAMWSGVTTLEWAKHCFELITHWTEYKTENIIQGECLSKYNLLQIIKEIFEVNIDITADDSVVVNKCLIGSILAPSIETQLIELKQFYYKNQTTNYETSN